MKTFVIAEAAGCHDGEFEKAERLVDLAASVGADSVKFQWTSSPERLAERRRAPEYLPAYRTLAFPRAWHGELAARAAVAGLEYMCTVYLPEDVAVVAPHVRRFKVASFEATDAAFVALHGFWPEKQLVISAGMGADLRGPLEAYAKIVHCLLKEPSIRVLHCVSAYPCPTSEANLGRLLAARPWIADVPLSGFSDHTRHPWTGALAVAAGAEVLEFHVRLVDTSPGNADFAVARAPDEAREYVRCVRFAESVMGDGAPGPRAVEEPYMRYRVGAVRDEEGA